MFEAPFVNVGLVSKLLSLDYGLYASACFSIGTVWQAASDVVHEYRLNHIGGHLKRCHTPQLLGSGNC